MTEDALIRKGPLVLQSCTMSSNSAQEVRIKVEEDTDVSVKVEEIPEDISFPPIKAEQDEVSYVSLCLLLDTFHQCPEKPAALRCLHLFVCPTTSLCCIKISFSFGLCESLVRKFASKYILISDR